MNDISDKEGSAQKNEKREKKDMRKRRFVCGMLALCLTLSAAGCGKDSKEQQAANYYQNELGLDKEDAENLAHELYGKDDEKPSVTEAPKDIVIEPLPELVNSEWWERKVQILDMVFTRDEYLTEEVIRKTVAGSAYDVEIFESFDENGDIILGGIVLNGKVIAYLSKSSRNSEQVRMGLCEEGDYYYFRGDLGALIPSTTYSQYQYSQSLMEIEAWNFKTRDDVLAYLAENGFVEVKKEQAPYDRETVHVGDGIGYGAFLVLPSAPGAEYTDVPHYFCKGAQSISFYRIHKVSENDQEIDLNNKTYSGIHLNLVEEISFQFNTDGTIFFFRPEYDAGCRPYIILGEQIKE